MFQDMTTSVHAISGYKHFGTCCSSVHEVTIRRIVTSGHAQTEHRQSLRNMSYRDKHDSGLHNCTITSYCTGSSHGKSVQALIWP